MDALQKIQAKLKELGPKKILKFAGIAIAIGVVLALATNYFWGMPNMAGYELGEGKTAGIMRSTAPSLGMADMEMAEGVAYDGIMPPVPQEPDISSNAEDYEVTEYRATAKARDLEDACLSIAELKDLDYVIFERANEYERGCSYYFKTEKDRAEEILEIINALDPETLTESTYTIVKAVENITTETEILERKLASVEKTLADAEKAYDQIAAIATSAKDAESLAKIIDSKIRTIERLTSEKISIVERLGRLAKNKAEQLERLDYVNFNVSISEIKYFDIDDIKNSWRSAIRNTIDEANQIMQKITVDLAVVILRVAQMILYAIIALLIAKHGWGLAKRYWKK